MFPRNNPLSKFDTVETRGPAVHGEHDFVIVMWGGPGWRTLFWVVLLTTALIGGVLYGGLMAGG